MAFYLSKALAQQPQQKKQEEGYGFVLGPRKVWILVWRTEPRDEQRHWPTPFYAAKVEGRTSSIEI